MNKKAKSTHDQLVDSLTPKEKEEFEQDYQKLILSELILAIMEKDEISARKLAKAAGIYPTSDTLIVQAALAQLKKQI